MAPWQRLSLIREFLAKKAGEDVKILANRIALLKAEEQKAWKKIEETKKKAQDILEVRHRNITKNTNKNQFKNQ
jgi:hypothetical protein